MICSSVISITQHPQYSVWVWSMPPSCGRWHWQLLPITHHSYPTCFTGCNAEIFHQLFSTLPHQCYDTFHHYSLSLHHILSYQSFPTCAKNPVQALKILLDHHVIIPVTITKKKKIFGHPKCYLYTKRDIGIEKTGVIDMIDGWCERWRIQVRDILGAFGPTTRLSFLLLLYYIIGAP